MVSPTARLWRSMRGAALLAILGCLTIACAGGSEAGPPDVTTGTFTSGPEMSTATATSTSAPTATRSDPTATDAETALAAPTATATQPEPTAAPTPSPTVAGEDAPVIVLDPGHDRTRPSALGIEYQDVLKTALYTQAALEAAGYQVFLTRPDNEMVFVDDPTLLPPNADDFHPGYSHAYAHASKALQFDPDLVIVLHFNGHSNPDVAGIEVYYCENGGGQNLALAEITRDELVAALLTLGYETPSARVIEDIAVARGNRHFPSLGNVYDFPRVFLHNRYAGIPVVLTEPLYETNPAERALIEDEATHLALAEAYVRIVDRWFGLDGR